MAMPSCWIQYVSPNWKILLCMRIWRPLIILLASQPQQRGEGWRHTANFSRACSVLMLVYIDTVCEFQSLKFLFQIGRTQYVGG
jgi:hypothetical protein